ncbi:MAG: hypothetical protein HRU75_06450 [Planctomycetia bacterium]|nr:MAG: hypothetical protein HRU75_06450 [Planctomycetia bacterium]
MKTMHWLLRFGLPAVIGAAALAQPRHEEGGAPPPPPPPGAEDGARGPGRLHRPPLGDPLIRGLAERNPELAARLARLRRDDPDTFHQLMIDALVPQLEEALDAINAPPGEPPDLDGGAGQRPPRGPGMRPGAPGRRPPGRMPGGPPPHPGMDERPDGPPPHPRPGMDGRPGEPPHPGMDGRPDGPPRHPHPRMGGVPHGEGDGPHGDGRPLPPRSGRGHGMGPPPRMSEEEVQAEREFGERFEALRREHASQEQAVRRLVREHQELPAGAEGPRAELRGRLIELINAQFDARTRLREMEVERLRLEVARIEKAVAEIGAELQQRGADRARIIERRAEELLRRGKASE